MPKLLHRGSVSFFKNSPKQSKSSWNVDNGKPSFSSTWKPEFFEPFRLSKILELKNSFETIPKPYPSESEKKRSKDKFKRGKVNYFQSSSHGISIKILFSEFSMCSSLRRSKLIVYKLLMYYTWKKCIPYLFQFFRQWSPGQFHTTALNALANFSAFFTS